MTIRSAAIIAAMAGAFCACAPTDDLPTGDGPGGKADDLIECNDGRCIRYRDIAPGSISGHSMAVSTTGDEHFLYMPYSTDEITHTVRKGTSTTSELVEDGTSFGFTLASDAFGGIHGIYENTHGVLPGALRYAHWQDDLLQLESVVDDGDKVVWASDMSIDASGTPHLVWVAPTETGYHLEYATHTTSGWSVEVIVTAQRLLSATAIAVDSSGRPHVLFRRKSSNTNTPLEYAHRDGAAWVTEQVWAAPAGKSFDIAVGPDDIPHVALADWNGATTTLQLARRFDLGSETGWVYEALDTSGSTGLLPSIDIHDDGTVHVAHIVWDLETDTMKELRHTAGVPAARWQTVRIAGQVFAEPVLDVDGDGFAHIAYDERLVPNAFVGSVLRRAIVPPPEVADTPACDDIGGCFCFDLGPLPSCGSVGAINLDASCSLPGDSACCSIDGFCQLRPAPSCEPQEAHGSGGCLEVHGVRWNGQFCQTVSGCECIGPDCGFLYGDSTQCEQDHLSCGG